MVTSMHALANRPAANEELAKLNGDDYREEAKLLACTYMAKANERDYLKSVLDHSFVYTEDMAISDLTNVTVKLDKDPVQSSHIPNQPESITMKLEDGYVDQMNRRIQKEAERDRYRIGYLDWCIHVVDTAVKYRTKNPLQEQIFKRAFKQKKSYQQIKKEYRKQLYNHTIADAKSGCLYAIGAELAMRACLPTDDWIYLEMIRSEIKANGDGKQ